MIKEQHRENKERLSDYMEMTFKKRRLPADCTEQEYEIMSYVNFRRRKPEMHEDDGKLENNSIYEEYDG